MPLNTEFTNAAEIIENGALDGRTADAEISRDVAQTIANHTGVTVLSW